MKLTKLFDFYDLDHKNRKIEKNGKKSHIKLYCLFKITQKT